MKKKIKVATALTICGVVLVGAIYYTNSTPLLLKATAAAPFLPSGWPMAKL